MPKIFISYRRDDAKAWAGRIYNRLIQSFGDENVFMDKVLERTPITKPGPDAKPEVLLKHPAKPPFQKVMKRHACEVCGYVYDPLIGDPEDGIMAGSDFDGLSADWVCPVCGADKESFSPV